MKSITHEKLLELHAKCVESAKHSLPTKEREPGCNRLLTAFNMAIREAGTTAELRALKDLMGPSCSGEPEGVCPKAAQQYLENAMRYLIPVEAKMARTNRQSTQPSNFAQA